MQVEENVKSVIDKLDAGELNELLSELDGSNFGVHLPVYEDQGTVKMMLEGYSQIERDLVISVGPNEVDDDALQIGWFGRLDGKDSSCRHGGEDRCRHCTGHGARCRHCTHPRDGHAELFDAPGLDYHSAIQGIENKQQLLDALAPEGLGLTLLHGHSSQHMFTELPSDYVSVIAGGKTEFRRASDVAQDPTFVPSVWRVINGQLSIAGGHSELITE